MKGSAGATINIASFTSEASVGALAIAVLVQRTLARGMC